MFSGAPGGFKGPGIETFQGVSRTFCGLLGASVET